MILLQKIRNRFFWMLRKIKKYRNLAYFKYASDKAYIKKVYKEKLGRRLNLRNPETFNEKLQWLKLYNRNPQYTTMVDKYKAREYITERVGAKYLIPLLGVWDDPDQIDFDALPDQFVLKCTHNSGLGMCICKDKSAFNFAKVKDDLRKGLNQDFYKTSREWPYKNVVPRIIAEKYMSDVTNKDSEKGLDSLKVFCFNGEPKLFFVYQAALTPHGEKPKITSCDVFDTEWNHQPVWQYVQNAEEPPKKPLHLNEMIRISRSLAEGIPFLRVDFYEINEKVYIGELTLFPSAGFIPFHPEEWDYALGSWLTLPHTH